MANAKNIQQDEFRSSFEVVEECLAKAKPLERMSQGERRVYYFRQPFQKDGIPEKQITILGILGCDSIGLKVTGVHFWAHFRCKIHLGAN